MKTGVYILGSNHQPIEVDMKTWSTWFNDTANRRVAVDTGPGWRLSSVCLGMEHGFDNGKPLIFETMLFREDSNAPDNQDMDRFTSWDECKAAHDAWVARLREQE